ncbi:MAG TPA: 50S ribosomal protein L25/general stress protein Ctc [Zoogloea sp.]|uniref:50S ribosomal protein L25/general stress protein Ctc n=1 Tax=Zoogloea sp. TaxID=49181 RepID=UPI002CBC9EC6|nr:50S ribosomal protein L25/general stress protein Ctc [Zoogloea sp.]HMV16924.1 50S ribosomal protein L25/general stress protein Ctc [Rhodocyclaceae bacterium]HMV62828.1 50S ribosomal protein L25/general stress protein Ctc [Rhodocyclaceae bacterium]HMW51572.1 50S ribosomal protein L25/general stress protein Ctc [Rhodocyclaceae bacterium]HMY49459.1 50S ribosomal protein L25/general stress protein Ctc [Rhodocyclaceae bacterium]HMZ75863.1 50S ribosomal protein L25/general stress protein Ctc [Rho
MTIQFNASKREAQGSSASRRLRRAGRVPAIIYGGEVAPLQVELDHNEIFHLLRNEAFHSSVLTALVDGAAQAVILRDTQWHPYKQQVLHLDFQRVDSTHKIHVKVPLHFVNADIAPGVKLEGGIVSHVMTELDLECLPGDLPEFVEVDLKDLKGGASIHVSHLPLPAGVKALTHGEDPVVATILAVRGGGEDEAAAETPAA